MFWGAVKFYLEKKVNFKLYTQTPVIKNYLNMKTALVTLMHIVSASAGAQTLSQFEPTVLGF